MILPADLSEGWYWVRWADDAIGPTVHRVYLAASGTLKIEGVPVERLVGRMTAMERVAAPSWERGDG